MSRTFHSSVACFILWSLAAGTVTAQQEDSESNPRDVYRLQPTQEGSEQVLVPESEIKAGLAYNYYNERLGRRVWGFAKGDGTFLYAFGEGSVLPTTRFDLRLSPEAETRILERGAPGLMEALATTGSTPAVRLNSENRWELLEFRSIARVFDLETGHRWEWHGGRRKAVLHTYGDQWRLVGDRYVPATGPVVVLTGCHGPVRAGSAVLVMRTPSHP